MAKTALTGRGTTVLLDAWYNSQTRTNAAGQSESYHYKWQTSPTPATGSSSMFGRAMGRRTETLSAAPTAERLRQAQVYLIVSPDIPAKNPNPHYVAAEDVAAVAEWVRQGGVLELMHNDSNSTEYEHFNRLAEAFGIHYNAVDNNQVPGSDYEKGKLMIPEGNAIFSARKIYMKEIDSIRRRRLRGA